MTRLAFVTVGWYLLAGPLSAFERLEPIIACPLARLPRPVPAPLAQCESGHCVDLGEGKSICKCQADDYEMIVFENEKAVQRWPIEFNNNYTQNFEVLSGALRGDRQELLIVVNHDTTSNGLGITYWSINVLDPTDLRRAPISWETSEHGLGSFAKAVNQRETGCDILITEWSPGSEPDGKVGLYFVGTWFRLSENSLTQFQTRRKRLRRYLSSFQRERNNYRAKEYDFRRLQGSPAQWLRPSKAKPPEYGITLKNTFAD